MHVFAMLLKCCCSDWVASLEHMSNWPARYTLYVTMSLASSGPAGLDLMDQSNPLHRDPYITCRSRRHNTPQLPQAPPVTFTFPLDEGLIWARIKLHLHAFLIFSLSESGAVTGDLYLGKEESWGEKVFFWKTIDTERKVSSLCLF